MVDTYGARLDEIRAFIEHGWAAMVNNEGSLSGHGELFRLSHADFEAFVVLSPRLQPPLLYYQGDHTKACT